MYPEAPENGIYIFPEDAEVGASAIEALGRNDVVFEYEVTSNRVDCYSVIGIAREAAATFDKAFVPPIVTETGNEEDVNDYIKVTVEDAELFEILCKSCKKYQDRSFTKVDAEETGICRNPSDQQSGRHHKLCDGRVRTADACIRSGYDRRS